ncbi:MAG: peptidoglycan DD-metalloendopeptidase family protein [Candidatus Ratteibacteria bacterium]|jgi:lipoprotein NlpD
MKKVKIPEIIFFLFIVTGCAPVPEKGYWKKSSAAAQQKETVSQSTLHIVRKGENLYRIAKYYGVTIEQIKETNKLLSDEILLGQKLRIPGVSKTQPLIALTPDLNEALSSAAPVSTQPPVPAPEKILLWPLKGTVICNYGEMGNKGIDILTAPSATVRASRNGKVSYAGTTAKYGETIIIAHANDLFTVYGHDLIIKVRQGQNVKAGDIIGVMKAGDQTRRYLHFEVRVKNLPVNPWGYISKKSDA